MMENVREREEKETKRYNPLYYIVYERRIYPDNCMGFLIQEEEDDFASLEGLVKWIVEMQDTQEDFEILYIKKIMSLNDRDWKAIDSAYKQEVEAYKKRKEKEAHVLRQRLKKQEEKQKKLKEDEEKKEYERLRKKYGSGGGISFHSK